MIQSVHSFPMGAIADPMAMAERFTMQGESQDILREKGGAHGAEFVSEVGKHVEGPKFMGLNLLAMEVHEMPTPSQPTAMQPDPDFTPCRCRGGNKDCCFCGGRGIYTS